MRRQHFCIPGAHRLTPLAIPGTHDSRMTHAPMYVFLANNGAKRTCADNTSVFQGLTDSRPFNLKAAPKKSEPATGNSLSQTVTSTSSDFFLGSKAKKYCILE